jgi:hypothetical protein
MLLSTLSTGRATRSLSALGGSNTLPCCSHDDPDCLGMMLTTSAKHDVMISGGGYECQAVGDAAGDLEKLPRATLSAVALG